MASLVVDADRTVRQTSLAERVSLIYDLVIAVIANSTIIDILAIKTSFRARDALKQ